VPPTNTETRSQSSNQALRRKRAKKQIAGDEKLASLSGDIETYIHLAQEETNVEQKKICSKSGWRAQCSDSYISELETRTSLRETDHLNAIMTIKPGAGGRNRRTGLPSFFACICAGGAQRMSAEFSMKRGRRSGLKSATINSRQNAYGLLAGETASTVSSEFSVRSGRAAPHIVCVLFVIPESTTASRSTSVRRLRVDTFRSGGKGGQNVNKVETASALPSSTNIVACQPSAVRQESRMAMKMLRSACTMKKLKTQAHTDSSTRAN